MAEGASGRKLTCPTVVHLRLHVNSYAPPVCAHTVTCALVARRELIYSVTGHQERLCRCVLLTGSSNSGCLISCSYFTVSHVPFFAVQHSQNTLGYVWKYMCMSLCLSCVQPAFTGYLISISKASSQVLCNVDRILISCFADCEVSVNKHRQLALTGDNE